MDDGKVDNQAEQINGIEPERKLRQRRSVQEKRRMVEATLVAGASIARVARAYGVNANQLFHWRKLYKQGRLEESGTPISRLLPVHITDLTGCEMVKSCPPTLPGTTSTIHIEIAGKGRLSIEGCGEHWLRTVLECWLR